MTMEATNGPTMGMNSSGAATAARRMAYGAPITAKKAPYKIKVAAASVTSARPSPREG
jgi:hypothetical protein